jgi:orotate phosphoribosyltransferase
MSATFDAKAAWMRLEESGAYLKGHFLLTTGRHSNQIFLLARLTERPDWLSPWAEALAGRLEPYRCHTVVGPAVGGIIPAYAVAGYWPGARMLFAEKSDDGMMRFKRGFRIEPGEKVVVVEDAVTTGSSVAKVVAAVKEQGGLVQAVGALIDRSEGSLRFSEPLVSLIQTGHIPNWDPQDCPLCQQGMPLSRPKS